MVGVAAERVMDLDIKEKAEDGLKAATIMHQDYNALYDKLSNPDCTLDTLTRADYAKLLVGAFIVARNIEDTIVNQQKALEGYKLDTLPKLERINKESTNDEEAQELAKKLF